MKTVRILIIYVWIVSGSSVSMTENEPHCACSKFPYEEKLLEKMVRMEFAMERMKIEMEEAKQSVLKTVEEFGELKTNYEEQLQHKSEKKGPLFTARLSNHIDKLGSKQTVVFDDVVTNVGNAYSKVTGVFTAPRNGVYYFIATLMSNSGQLLKTEMVKNGLTVAKMFSYDKSYEQGTSGIVLELKTSDEVWVRQMQGEYVYGSIWSMFSGFLVTE